MPGCFRHPFCGASCGRGQHDPDMEAGENFQDGIDDRGLSCSRSSGDDQDLVESNAFYGLYLIFRKVDG